MCKLLRNRREKILVLLLLLDGYQTQETSRLHFAHRIPERFTESKVIRAAFSWQKFLPEGAEDRAEGVDVLCIGEVDLDPIDEPKPVRGGLPLQFGFAGQSCSVFSRWHFHLGLVWCA